MSPSFWLVVRPAAKENEAEAEDEDEDDEDEEEEGEEENGGAPELEPELELPVPPDATLAPPPFPSSTTMADMAAGSGGRAPKADIRRALRDARDSVKPPSKV